MGKAQALKTWRLIMPGIWATGSRHYHWKTSIHLAWQEPPANDMHTYLLRHERWLILKVEGWIFQQRALLNDVRRLGLCTTPPMKFSINPAWPHFLGVFSLVLACLLGSSRLLLNRKQTHPSLYFHFISNSFNLADWSDPMHCQALLNRGSWLD